MQLKWLHRRHSVALAIIKCSEGRHSCCKRCDFLAAQMLRVRKEQRLDFSAQINGHALPVLFMELLQGTSTSFPCISAYLPIYLWPIITTQPLQSLPEPLPFLCPSAICHYIQCVSSSLSLCWITPHILHQVKRATQHSSRAQKEWLIK